MTSQNQKIHKDCDSILLYSPLFALLFQLSVILRLYSPGPAIMNQKKCCSMYPFARKTFSHSGRAIALMYIREVIVTVRMQATLMHVLVVKHGCS